MMVRFVPIDKFLIYLAQGWVVASDLADSHHGQYSVLMEKAAD